MDNLEELWCHSVVIDEKRYGKCVACCFSDGIACVITDSNYMSIYELSKLGDVGISTKLKETKLKYLHYLSTFGVIFVATDFQLIVYDRNNLKKIVCHDTSKQIVTLAWNPTETVLVVINAEDEISLYHFSKSYFELKCTADLHVSVPNTVYVGWGSETTQFRGPKGRQQKKNDTTKSNEVIAGPPRISWRGNGKLFVVNLFKDSQRFIKVFDSQLNPLYMSKEYDNLREPVSFMVAGQCVACCAMKDDINTIVIFEKNCKLRSVFEIPESKGIIEKIQYHPQMNMLAVLSSDDHNNGYISIYLHTNGIWALKQQLYFPSNRRVYNFEWENVYEPVYTICKMVVFTSENIHCYTFRFIINRCPGTTLTAVVDGRNINFYNFSENTVPPPLKHYSIDHIRPINRILFHPHRLLCVALDAKLQAMVIDVEKVVKLFMSEELNLSIFLHFHSILWSEKDQVVINLEYIGEDQPVMKTECNNLPLKIKISKQNSLKIALPYNDTNSLISFKILEDHISTLIYLSKKILKVGTSQIEIDFALSSNRELYVNGKVVYSGITSIFIFQDYLLLTTANCRMHCIRLLQEYDILLKNQLDLAKTYSRQIEQGARIVNNNNNYPPQIIFTLPRGNLETNSCRLITVDIIEKLLSENKWKAAIDIIRVERMNWNILIDLNPERFSEHIEDFVKAAEYGTILNMMVNEFRNSASFYDNCLPNIVKIKYDKTEIVTKILEYIGSQDLIGNLISIVSIQQKHFPLKVALNSIKRVFEIKSVVSQSACSKALKYLCIKDHFEDVINVAYSFFDLDFVLFIYRNSGQDPSIYENDIKNLRNLEPVELRFKMSLKADNKKEAIKYLVRCKGYDKQFVEHFIKIHKLEDVAYKSLPVFYEQFVLVSILYAKKLSQQKKHSESAFVLKRISLMQEALEEYSKALDWREVLHLLSYLNYEESERKKVLYHVSDGLLNANRIDEAVLVLDHYNNDYKKAIQVLVDNKAFKKAIDLAKIHKDSNILENSVIPALKFHILQLKYKIDEYETTFQQYSCRLQVLRLEKQTKLENTSLGLYDAEDDLFSESGSTVSSLGSHGTSQSRGSTLSSKNRRKEERKKINIREGGYYEDIALIRALHILYSNVFEMGKEVREVCLILDHGDIKLCKSLHEQLSNLQDIMKNEIRKIWPEVFVNVPDTINNAVLSIMQNKADLDPKYCDPPSDDILNTKWKVDMFL